MDFMHLLESAELFFLSIEYYVNTLVVLLVILLVGFIVGRLTDRLLYKSFLRLDLDGYVTKLLGFRRHYARATTTAIVNTIYVLTVLVALRQINADRVVLTFVFGLFLFIIFVSLLLAGVELLPNFFAWWKLRRDINVGDTLVVPDKTGKITGVVARMTFTDTCIQLKKGDVVFVPNSTLARVKVIKKA